MNIPQLLLLSFAVVAAAMLSAVMTWAFCLGFYGIALAKPNARSSHRIPTPQGAGIAVIAPPWSSPVPSSLTQMR